MSGWLPGVLNQAVMPVKFGARPRAGRSVLLAMKTGVFCGEVPDAGVVVVVVVVPGSEVPALGVALVGGGTGGLLPLQAGRWRRRTGSRAHR